jgi:hypothetical protein
MLKSPIVTRLEVISDAIKIDLPSLLTRLTALFIARATRSHELKKESSRRRQDALEKISDDFQAAYSSLVDLLPSYYAYLKMRDEPTGRVAFQDFQKSADAMEAAIEELPLIEGRLKLLRLKKSTKVFLEYVNEANALRCMLRLPPDPNVPSKEMLRAKADEVKLRRAAVESSLADAFDSL